MASVSDNDDKPGKPDKPSKPENSNQVTRTDCLMIAAKMLSHTYLVQTYGQGSWHQHAANEIRELADKIAAAEMK